MHKDLQTLKEEISKITDAPYVVGFARGFGSVRYTLYAEGMRGYFLAESTWDEVVEYVKQNPYIYRRKLRCHITHTVKKLRQKKI